MRRIRVLAYFSLIFGGFLLITQLAFLYYAIWHNEFLPIVPFRESNFTRAFPREQHVNPDPIGILLSPFSLGMFITSIAFLVNGVVIMQYLHVKELKDTRHHTVSTMLTDDEKRVFNELTRLGGEATQKELSLRTGFQAVKTHRVLTRLERRKVIRVFPFGMTNKIVLNDMGKE